MRKITTIFFIALLLTTWTTQFQKVTAQVPVVEGLLFFSPSCGHCEEVIKYVLPSLKDQYQQQLSITQVDVSQPDGQDLYRQIIAYYNIPDDRLGVPTLIVGENVLVGSVEIPDRLPNLITAGIDNGGVNLQPIPGLIEYLVQHGQKAYQIDEPKSNFSEMIISRFLQDPAGNTLATIVLIAMVASIIYVTLSFITGNKRLTHIWPKWVVPVLAVIGLGIALYLSFVETTKTEAICGPIGNCNSVQQSPYAYIFGVIPIGVLGSSGYISILALWISQRFLSNDNKKKIGLIIWVLAWFGVAFSIYLTFLEPFVIGATCIWCISSAIVMTLILWVTTPLAKYAMQSEDDAAFGWADA